MYPTEFLNIPVTGEAFTTATHFQIPPGWIERGKSYSLSVTAYDREGDTFIAHPLEHAPVEQSAPVMSEQFAVGL